MDASDGQDDFKNLPLLERLQHKLWKARLSAYVDLTKLFSTTDNESDFYTYEERLKTMVTDANAAAQEAGLNAAYEFVANAPNPTNSRDSVVPALVEKCLNATKAGTKQKAADLILLYAEVDTVNPVVELVIPGINAKQPKLVTQTVVVLRELVRQFGTKNVSPKPILKTLPKLFGHADKNVRAETSSLTIELYHWLGPALNPFLTELKPVQVKELEEAFSKLPSTKPVPQRLLRSEQAAEAIEAPEVEMDEGQNEAEDEAMDDQQAGDPYDLADPVDITAKLPGDLYELLIAKKWTERQGALDSILKAAKVIKIMDKDYSELIGALVKRINDAHILLVGSAANCIEAIANGLRQDFSKYKAAVTPPMIEKLKERKPAVLEQIASGLNAVFATVPLVDIVDDITTGIKHKNPQVRSESVKLVTRRLKEIRDTPSMGELKAFAGLMIKVSDDADANVREASLEGLGTLMKVTGEKAMSAYTEKLEDIKMTKVKEAFEKAEVKVKVAAAKKSVPPPKAVQKAPPRKQAPVAKEASPMLIDDESAAPGASATPKRKPTSRPGGGSLKKPMLASSKLKPATSSAVAANATPKKAAKLPPSSGPEEVRYKFSADDAEARATEFIPEEIWNNLSDSQWKVRLAAIQSLYTHFESQDPESTEPEIVIRCLSKKPGWKENNFQVMGKLFAVMQLIASQSTAFPKSCGAIGIPALVEKLGDIKLKKPATECLAVFAEKISLQFVFSLSYPVLKKAKSPKILADSLVWIHSSLMEFGIAGLQVRDMIDFLKYCLTNTNPAVRTNAVTALGALRLYIGPEVKSFVQDVSPGLLTTIDAEFDKVAAMEPPQPTKASAAAPPSGPDALDSLLPRIDISSALSKLASECNDSNWKTRKSGLDKTLAVIEGANKRIKPNLGDFPSVLKQRLNDSNKNLQIQTAEITALLALSMGKPFEKYAKLLASPVTAILADNKANVRAAGVATLEQFRQVCGVDLLIGTFATSLVADSPTLRKDLLVWLNSCLNENEPCDLSPMVSPLFACLQDRNADVRKAAQVVLPAIVASVGYEIMIQKTTELNGSQRQTIMPMIEALRGSLPKAPNGKSANIQTTDTDARQQEVVKDKVTPSTSRIKPLGVKKIGSPATRTGAAATTSTAASATPPPAAEQAQAPILTSDPRGKLHRAKKEIRWQFDAPRPDFIESLRALCEQNMSSAVCNLLFSTHQYAERDRLSALGILDECIATPDVAMIKYNVDPAEMKQRCIVNADILLKYLTIRFFDTNTSMLIKCLDVAQHIVAVMDEEGYHLSEYEAVSFLPFLISKVGDPKEIMRVRVREILKAVCRIYPGSKLFSYLLESAANSKNAKTRAECLEETGSLIQRNGVSVMLPNKALPLIANHIGDRDAGVRNAALSAIAQAYILMGDTVFKFVTRLGEKEKGMLEERLKRTKPSASVLAEREAKAQQEAEAMEVDEIPTISHLPRHPRSQPNKQRMVPPSSIQRYSANAVPSDTMDETAQHEYNQPTRRLVPAPSSMRQPRSMQAMPQAAQQLDRREYNTDVVDYLIAQIMSGDPQPSIEALKQLDKLLSTKPSLVLTDLERLINAITLQVRLSYSSVKPDDPATTRLCKHLVNALVLVFSNLDLAMAVSQDALHHLLQELAHRLLDHTMLSMESGPQLSKALNVAMVKVLENSQRNVTFSALLSILGSCSKVLRPGESAATKETKYTELIMKCLWKLAKTIQENLRNEMLRADQLLYEINNFFRATPPAEWKRRAAEHVPLGEMPLRTVKTLLLELVNGLGDGIFGHLNLIDDPERSNVYPYLHHMLEACRKKERIQHQQQLQTNPVKSDDQRSVTSQSQASSLSRPSSITSTKSNGMGTMLRSGSMTSFPAEESTAQDGSGSENHEQYSGETQVEPMQVDDSADKSMSDYEMNNQLKQIFDKIGTRDQTKQGIIELYEFQKKHPSAEAKVNTYLNQTGSYFPSYIRRGLNNLAAEDNEMRATSGMATSHESQPPASPVTASPPTTSSPMSGVPIHEHNRHSFDNYSRTSADRPTHHAAPGAGDDIKERLLRLQQTFGYRNENEGSRTNDMSIGRLPENNGLSSHASFAAQRTSLMGGGQSDGAYIAGETDRAQSVSALKEKLAKINK